MGFVSEKPKKEAERSWHCYYTLRKQFCWGESARCRGKVCEKLC